MHTYMCIYTCTHTYIHVHVCIHVHIYIHIHVCIPVYVLVYYIYIHCIHKLCSLGLQWRRWSVDDLGYLLLAAMLESPCPVSQIPLLFKYFDKVTESITLDRYLCLSLSSEKSSSSIHEFS